MSYEMDRWRALPDEYIGLLWLTKRSRWVTRDG